jgi:hypothetical protein
MFGHLKARDFVNLMEGVDLPAKYRSHLDACARCRTTWKSLESVHADFSSEVRSLDDEIPEPDWLQFRSSVRDRVLSRSIQRETAVRRWTGWAIRPAMAWALSLFLVVGVTTVTVMWNSGRTETPSNSVEMSTSEPVAETVETGPERGLFDDLIQLGDDEQEQFQLMLESSQKGSRYR